MKAQVLIRVAALAAALVVLPGCRAQKEKKEWSAVAPAISGSIQKLHDLDADLTQHMDALRAVPRDQPMEGMVTARAVVKDHQVGEKAAKALADDINRAVGSSLSIVHDINLLHIAAMEYANTASCTDPLFVGQFGMPKDKECLPKCEAAWGKLVDASGAFTTAAKTAGYDVRPIRDR
jgi:hypothetical protein